MTNNGVTRLWRWGNKKWLFNFDGNWLFTMNPQLWPLGMFGVQWKKLFLYEPFVYTWRDVVFWKKKTKVVSTPAMLSMFFRIETASSIQMQDAVFFFWSHVYKLASILRPPGGGYQFFFELQQCGWWHLSEVSTEQLKSNWDLLDTTYGVYFDPRITLRLLMRSNYSDPFKRWIWFFGKLRNAMCFNWAYHWRSELARLEVQCGSIPDLVKQHVFY